MVETGEIATKFELLQDNLDLHMKNPDIKNLHHHHWMEAKRLRKRLCKMQKEIDRLKKEQKSQNVLLIKKKNQFTNLDNFTDEQVKHFFEDEEKQLDEFESRESTCSSRYFNYIQTHLVDSVVCKTNTGCSRREILNQAKLCREDPRHIYWVRMKIKLNMHKHLIAQIHGFAESSMTKIWKRVLPRLVKNYAYKWIVNPSRKQYFTREKIFEEFTPEFCKDLFSLSQDRLGISADSTYQYICKLNSDHSLKRKTYCQYKNQRHLLKVHLFCTLDGKPMYAIFTFADGPHNDGKIYEGSMCKDFIRKAPEEFASKDVIKEMKYMQSLQTPQDRCIVDNGYPIVDCRLLFTRKMKNISLDKRGSVNEQIMQRRYNMGAREAHERTNRRLKCYRMLGEEIGYFDVADCIMAWKIAMADLVSQGWKSNDDTPTKKNLTARLKDMLTLLNNPADIFLPHNYVHKYGSKNKMIAVICPEIEEEDESLTALSQSVKQGSDTYSTQFKKKTENLNDSLKYLREHQVLRDFFSDTVVEQDLHNVIGRTFENKKAIAYVHRILNEVDKFSILQHTNEEEYANVFKFSLVKSQHFSQRNYKVVLDFTQTFLWHKSLQYYEMQQEFDTVEKCEEELQNADLEEEEEEEEEEERLLIRLQDRVAKTRGCLLPHDEKHWLKHLQSSEQAKDRTSVSNFLHEKYKTREKILNKRRLLLVQDRRRKLLAGKWDMNAMTVTAMRALAIDKGMQGYKKCTTRPEWKKFLKTKFAERKREREIAKRKKMMRKPIPWEK